MNKLIKYGLIPVSMLGASSLFAEGEVDVAGQIGTAVTAASGLFNSVLALSVLAFVAYISFKFVRKAIK